MRTLAPGVHVAEAEQRFLGLELGARMTVLETDRGLVVHSPIGLDPASVQPFGVPRYVVAPNTLHHLYVGPWAEAGLEAWCAPGLREKRPDVSFAGVLAGDARPFGADVGVHPLTCFSLTNEVVLHHRPSRTLVVTDLVFNVPRSAPLLTRIGMACLCGYPGCRTTLVERVGFRRSVARREIGALLQLDFDRLILSHGEIIETDGKEALRGAVAWLGL